MPCSVLFVFLVVYTLCNVCLCVPVALLEMSARETQRELPWPFVLCSYNIFDGYICLNLPLSLGSCTATLSWWARLSMEKHHQFLFCPFPGIAAVH